MIIKCTERKQHRRKADSNRKRMLFYKGWHSCSTIIAKKHKKPYKPDSVLPLPGCLIFICVLHCCKTRADYPSALDGPPLIADILIIAPHRVYLVSLQPNCTFVLLHWSSYHYGRTLSAMLPCGVRTFLPFFCVAKKASTGRISYDCKDTFSS